MSFLLYKKKKRACGPKFHEGKVAPTATRLAEGEKKKLSMRKKKGRGSRLEKKKRGLESQTAPMRRLLGKEKTAFIFSKGERGSRWRKGEGVTRDPRREKVLRCRKGNGCAGTGSVFSTGGESFEPSFPIILYLSGEKKKGALALLQKKKKNGTHPKRIGGKLCCWKTVGEKKACMPRKKLDGWEGSRCFRGEPGEKKGKFPRSPRKKRGRRAGRKKSRAVAPGRRAVHQLPGKKKEQETLDPRGGRQFLRM